MRFAPALLIAALLFSVTGADAADEGLRVETQLLNPRLHPDDARRPVKPPGWELFGFQTHFTSIRGFAWRNGAIEGFQQLFDDRVSKFDLGDVIWPRIDLLGATNLPEVVAEIKRRNFFLYQIWGYVPGAGSNPQTPEMRISPAVSALFEKELGARWLGMDMGEQDGRYVLEFGRGAAPIANDRMAQYLNFHRFLAGVANDGGNKMSGLSAVSFSHYLAKEGIFTMLGAETAQEHPCSQVFYAFIRGAGKQYGVPWFGNVSVFNRWGWKDYQPEHAESGPTKGASLALMKRLLYSHLLYHCMIAGFENGWVAGEQLTPIGRMQQAAQQWVRAQGQLGVMQTPIALMTEFDAGWIFPSYNSVLYRVWGNLPYGPGDYLLNDTLGMIYPGYQDSSFFRDETGFATETPYGDAADVLLSDAPGWVLARYPVLVVAGALSPRIETRDKLQAYVEQGGRLYLTAGNLRNLPGGVGGLGVDLGPARSFAAGTKIESQGGAAFAEPQPFELLPLRLPARAEILAQASGAPATVRVQVGKGSVTAFGSAFGIAPRPLTNDPIKRLENQPLVNPFPLLEQVRRILDAAFREQKFIEAGDGLAVITCRRQAGDYTVAVSNNALSPRPLKIVSHVGAIQAIEEIALDQSEKTAVGYLPEGSERAAIGQSDAATIAGGDVRIFRIRVTETGVSELPPAEAPPAPRGRLLALSSVQPLEEQILRRPTFFQHFDGVVIDWKYVFGRDEAQLRREADWLARQQVQLVVDFTSGLNGFPDLRLVNNLESAYQRTMQTFADVFAKMPLLGARDAILSLSTGPENTASWKAYDDSVSALAKAAQAHGILLHLRSVTGRPGHIGQFLSQTERIQAPNLKIAPALGPLLENALLTDDTAGKLKHRLDFCFVSTPRKDVAGRTWTTDAPLAGSGYEDAVLEWLRHFPETRLILSGTFQSQDEEYLDAKVLEAARPN